MNTTKAREYIKSYLENGDYFLSLERFNLDMSKDMRTIEENKNPRRLRRKNKNHK